MLARILDSHSRVACPFEFAVPSLLGRTHWKYRTAKRKLSAISTAYRVPQRLALPTPFGLRVRSRLTRFLTTILIAENKDLFVVKEPAHVDVANRIVELFGRTAVVLMVRGPLATASSLANTFGEKRPLQVWANAHRILWRLASEGCHLVKYEALVEEPNATVRQLCSHIGVAFEPEMVEFGRFHHADDTLGLWYADKSDHRLVPVSQSKLHETVAKGHIDRDHNVKRLQSLPSWILQEYIDNAFGARALAQEMGYDELNQTAQLRVPRQAGSDKS